MAPRELVLGRADADRALGDLVRGRLRPGCRGRRSTTAIRPPRAGARVWRWGSTRRSCQRRPRAAAAAAAVLRYARATQPGAELPLPGLEIFPRTETLIIDEQARAHLELVGVAPGSPQHAGSLIESPRRDAHGDGGAAVASLAAVSVGRSWRRSARRHDAVERLGRRAREPAIGPRRAAGRGSPTSSGWSAAPASAWRRPRDVGGARGMVAGLPAAGRGARGGARQPIERLAGRRAVDLLRWASMSQPPLAAELIRARPAPRRTGAHQETVATSTPASRPSSTSWSTSPSGGRQSDRGHRGARATRGPESRR